MKLRIKGNIVRLRLTRSEVSTVGEGGRVQEITLFGPQAQFCYTLEAVDTPQLEAEYSNNTLTVRVPRVMAHDWATTDLVGLSTEQKIAENVSLQLIIEKDFTCLNPRGEEDSDTFEHPQTGQLTC
ncbi:MAG: Hsp20/alpha crystallin family protein [Blastocatellia bacterium]|nr:Hsp20/alpha crystallin family protein [Blastocatellia bacterium]